MHCNICGKEFENFKDLTRHLYSEHNFGIEEIYNYYGYSFKDKVGICPICGKEFKLSWRQAKKHEEGTSKGIGCCARCSRELIFMIYGNPSSRPEVKEKKKQRALEKYGVENVFQAREVKQKIKQTNLEKYGVEYVMQSSNIAEKSRKTNLEKYGVEHVSQRESIKERKRKKSLEKYGVENISQADEIKEKKKQASLKRYGVEYTLQASEVREKSKKTNLEKYGVEYVTQAKEVKEKMRETNLEKYGVEYASQAPEVKEKAKQTNLKKYGVEYAIASRNVRSKSKETMLEKYGVEYFCQHEKCSDASGCRISNINKKFHKLLESNNIENELEFIIENYGYDLKVGSTLIEMNPCFTHNSTLGPYFGGKRRAPLPHDYHLAKSTFAKENGYNCIHVFDWDNWDKIVYLLQSKSTMYARNCEVKKIDRKIADEFLGKYHLQGSTRTLQYAYGLYYKEELVEVMTFGKPRYNKNYDYELLRLCSAPNYTVVGGASKLLKFFEKQVKPESIISYCDLSKFNGDVYKKLGFKLSNRTAPTRHWYNEKTKRHITDILLRQRGYDQLHNTSFGKGTSNEELMLKNNYLEVYDCGQLVFVKNLK